MIVFIGKVCVMHMVRCLAGMMWAITSTYWLENQCKKWRSQPSQDSVKTACCGRKVPRLWNMIILLGDHWGEDKAISTRLRLPFLTEELGDEWDALLTTQFRTTKWFQSFDLQFVRDWLPSVAFPMGNSMRFSPLDISGLDSPLQARYAS